MTVATLTVKGQITIPKEMREALHIKNGDRMAFVADGDRAIMIPLKSDLLSLRGIFKKFAKGKQFNPDTIRSLLKRRVAEQYIVHRHGK